jgi:hypothetical protein
MKRVGRVCGGRSARGEVGEQSFHRQFEGEVVFMYRCTVQYGAPRIRSSRTRLGSGRTPMHRGIVSKVSGTLVGDDHRYQAGCRTFASCT